MEVKVKSTTELKGASRCTLYRNTTTQLGEAVRVAENTAMSRAQKVKRLALTAQRERWDRRRITEEVKVEFDEFTFATEKTRNCVEMVAVATIARFVDNFPQAFIADTLLEYKDVELQGIKNTIKVGVRPSFASIEKNASGTFLVNVSLLKTGRPNVTLRGAKKDTSLQYSLELYALLKYAEENLVPKGACAIVTASYTFLKRADDVFFSTKTSAASVKPMLDLKYGITREVTKDTRGKVTEIHNNLSAVALEAYFASIVEEYITGESNCTPEMCERCQFSPLCHFVAAPVAKDENEKEKRDVKNVTLDKTQEDIVNFNLGVARCNAGAGAGKTLVVALNIAMKILNGEEPESLIAITYTEAGATEMRKRIKLYLVAFGFDEELAEKVTISTINAFCDKLLLSYWDRLGFSAEPELVERLDLKRLALQVANDITIDGLNYASLSDEHAFGLYSLLSAFEICKKYELQPGNEERLLNLLCEKGNLSGFIRVTVNGCADLLKAYEEFQARLKKDNKYDFEDQIKMTFKLLRDDPYLLEQFGYKHIIVDEFQDCNSDHLELVKYLRDTPSFQSLLVVGDDDQCINGHQGASHETIVNFFDTLDIPPEDRREFFLVKNYRSVEPIIDLANKVTQKINKRIPKKLIATRGTGMAPVVTGYHKRRAAETDAALEDVVKKIEEKIAEGHAYSDICIEAADKTILNPIKTFLSEHNIPWVSRRPETLLTSGKVQAGIHLAKAIDNPTALNSIAVVANIMCDNEFMLLDADQQKGTIEDVKALIDGVSELSPNEKAERYVEILKSFDKDKDEVFENFIARMERRPTFSEQLKYIEMLELYGDDETVARHKKYENVVTLTTIHSSKGMEWPIVFVCLDKLDRGLIHYAETQRLDAWDDARRLLFVALTRARDELYVYGHYVSKHGESGDFYNPFLRDVFLLTGTPYDPVDHEAEAEKLRKEEERKQKARLARAVKKAEEAAAKEEETEKEESKEEEKKEEEKEAPSPSPIPKTVAITKAARNASHKGYCVIEKRGKRILI